MRDLVANTTKLVSTNSAGTAAANGYSDYGYISADGRNVAFRSTATNLVAGSDANTSYDVFLRESQAGTTALVSVNGAGTGAGNGESGIADISADGRYVALYSAASELVANDNNSSYDGFVRDMQTGTTTLVSMNSAGSGSGSNTFPTGITPDGRFVLFDCYGGDIAPVSDNNGGAP